MILYHDKTWEDLMSIVENDMDIIKDFFFNHMALKSISIRRFYYHLNYTGI